MLVTHPIYDLIPLLSNVTVHLVSVVFAATEIHYWQKFKLSSRGRYSLVTEGQTDGWMAKS